MADYPLRKNAGRGMAGLSRATDKYVDPREVQAMFADVASGVGVPFADAAANYLRGNIEGAKESAAIEGALSAIPLAAVAAKPVYRAAKRAVPGALETVKRMADEAIERETPIGQILEATGPSYAVKNKGGNWPVTYPSDDPLRDLKMWPTISGQIINDAAGRDIFSSYLRHNEDNPWMDLHDWTRENYPEIYKDIHPPEDTALNNWIDQKLGKYIRNEMGTPEDPLRRLIEERGITHIDPQILKDTFDSAVRSRRLGPNSDDAQIVGARRELAGFPRGGVAAENFRGIPKENLSPEELESLKDRYRMAGGWEELTDESIINRTAGDILAKQGFPREDQMVMLNPWIRKVPPETPIHTTRTFSDVRGDFPTISSLKFNYLLHDLYGAMSPNSALPLELRIAPDDLAKMNVPQAVERASKIRDWTTEEAARAERAGMLENLKASPRAKDESLNLSFVDKPGGTWVDIPETTDEAGHKICTSIGKSAGWCTQHSNLAREYGSGDNRLAALLDSEGRPHVQVKISKNKMYPRHEDTLQYIPEAEQIVLRENPGIDLADHDAQSTVAGVASNLARERQAPHIEELKPPQNSFGSDQSREYGKRDPRYRQKISDSVLDFLNNGEWSHVADLEHYNIVDTHPEHGNWEKTIRNGLSYDPSFSGVADIARTIRENNPELPRFMYKDEYRNLVDEAGYAEGGHVKGYAMGGSVGSPGFNFEHISLLADAL